MTTPFLGIDETDDAQDQFSVKLNIAREAIEAAISVDVLSWLVAAPPANPGVTDRYIVPSGASGIWTGQATKITYQSQGTWKFFTPRKGWIVWITSEDGLYTFNGTVWEELTAVGGTAATIPFDPRSSSLLGLNIQDALDEIAAAIDLIGT